MGLDAATEALRWGVNDLGGTLMEESISRLAGSYHGIKLDPAELIAAAHAAGRPAAERTTLYELRAHHPLSAADEDRDLRRAVRPTRRCARAGAGRRRRRGRGLGRLLPLDHVQTHGSLDVADPWMR